MDEESGKKVFVHEILVAIDTSKHSQAALQAAAALARTMGANIHGVFVHDEVWNRVSNLPSISVVNTFTGRISSFEDDPMEDHVRLLRNRLRRKLEYVSRWHQITHTWHFSKGKVEEEILDAAEEADLITIGLKGASARRKTLGTSAKRIIRKSNKPVLILKKGIRLGTTITAVYDGSNQSQKGIEMALNIAGRNESTLTILVINNNPEARGARNKELENLLQDTSVFIEIEFLDQPTAGRFLNSVNHQKCGLLIVPKNQPLLIRSLRVILKHINCPLLMVN